MDKRVKTALTVVKTVGCIAISIGIGTVAANLIKTTTPNPEDLKLYRKICVGIGSFFLSSLAAAAASKKFDDTIDVIAESVDKFTEEHIETGEIVIEGETG